MAPRVYFYCRNEPGNLQEDVISLAEGLRELGVPFHANCDYWQESTTPGDFLLRHDPDVRPDDCDIVVVSYTWPFWTSMATFTVDRRPLPDGLFKPGRTYTTVYIDNHDGHRTVSWEAEFRDFDLILRSKLNKRAWHPANMRPWVLGLNNRILAATAGALPFAQRRRAMLVNFGASHPYPHQLRDRARARLDAPLERIVPLDRTRDDLSREPADAYDALMWRQTGRRFSRSYYERLKANQFVACFCGELIPPMPYRRPERYLAGGNRARLRRAFFEALALVDPRPRRSVQWDSFRFWEALASGCVAVHVDLARHGVDLPVPPQDGTHYLAVDLDRVDGFIERLRDAPQDCARIAREGREWALANYSPKAMARRFLNYAGHACAPS